MRLSEAKRLQLVHHAAPVLVEGEEVLDVTIGSAEVKRAGKTTRRKATVLVTDRRVVVYSKMLGGYDVQEYAFGRLTGVDHNKGFTTGQLTLRASGGGADVSQIDRSDVERIAQAIRDRMSSARQSGGQADPGAPDPAGSESVAEELDRFARLRNDGVISDQEFAAQKAKLLS